MRVLSPATATAASVGTHSRSPRDRLRRPSGLTVILSPSLSPFYRHLSCSRSRARTAPRLDRARRRPFRTKHPPKASCRGSRRGSSSAPSSRGRSRAASPSERPTPAEVPAERRRPRAPVGPHSASYLPSRRRPGDLLRVGRTPPAGAHYGKGLPRARVLGRASVLGEDVWKEAFQCGCSGDPSNSVFPVRCSVMNCSEDIC